MPVLIDIDSPDRDEYHLGELSIIGSDRRCTVTLTDQLAAPQHARIRRDAAGRYELEHVDPRGATFVRGHPVQRVLLRDGDEILIGSSRLLFRDRAMQPIPALDVQIAEEAQVLNIHLGETTVDLPAFAPAARIVEESALRRDYEKLRAANELSKAIVGVRDLGDLLDRILQKTLELLGADRGAILLVDESSGKLVPKVAGQRSGARSALLLPSTIISAVAEKRSGIICSDATMDARFQAAESVQIQGIRSTMCVPMTYQGDLVGVIHVDSQRAPDLFGDTDLQLFNTIANQAALAVGNALLRRRIREQRRQTEKQERLAVLGQLAGGIAHDFNNLLSVMVNYTEFITESARGNTRIVEDTEVLRAAVDQAVGLTRQLLTFSRGDIGSPEVVDINETITEMRKLWSRTLGGHIDLRTRLDPGLCRIKIDRVKLEQVLMNLAINARDAMPQGGQLTFATRSVTVDRDEARRLQLAAEGPCAEILVADSGSGMKPEVCARIFEAFFTTKSKGRGTGLGLATVHDIITEARGQIEVESTPGAGTTFRILFPATADEAPLPAEEFDATVEQGTETILLVEEDVAVRTLAERILTEAGYHVLAARHGDEARRLLTEHVALPQLLISDILTTGPEFVARLRARLGPLKIVYLSGFLDSSLALQIERDGAAWVRKPIVRRHLLETVRQVIGGSPAVA
jgi:signal transduction histidine kinase